MEVPVAVMLDMKVLSGQTFWEVVVWCFEHGASEFTISLFTMGVSEEQYSERLSSLKQRLNEFSEPSQNRWRTDYCMWDEGMTDLWALNPASIEELKKTGIGTLFSQEEGLSLAAGPPELIMSAWEISEHYLCLYRDGLPMLVTFEEQGPEVYLYLDGRELDQFRGAGFQSAVHHVGGYVPDCYVKGGTAS